MAVSKLVLSVLPEVFAICRLDGASRVPSWTLDLGFFSVTRTEEEVSIVVPQAGLPRYGLPEEAKVDRDWRCLKVEGPLDLSLVGVLASLSGTLAAAGVSVFAVSTYDTDYLLVGELAPAVAALSEAGHVISGGPSGL